MTDETRATSLREACATILAKLCYPVADEIGADFAERMSNWRQRNATKILERASEMYNQRAMTAEHAPPRLVHKALAEGSWSEADDIQAFWAGLLISSCSNSGTDDGNLIFINILSQLTTLQAKVLAYASENAVVTQTPAGWLVAKTLIVNLADLQEVTGVVDFHRLDRELDHMRGLELISAGFGPHEQSADITPTTLALQMYARCQGFIGSPAEYYGVAGDE